MDCAGFCYGLARRDCAGVCSGNSTLDKNGTCCLESEQDCRPICGGTWSRDECKKCLPLYSPKRNHVCRGCDGRLEPNAYLRKHYDACGECGGDGSTCDACTKKVLHAKWPIASDYSNSHGHGHGHNQDYEREEEEEEEEEEKYGQAYMVPMPLGELSVNEWYNYDGNDDRSFGGSGVYPARPRTLRVLAVRDVSGRTFFVFMLSSARHGKTRGQAWLKLTSNMTGFPLTVQVEDDPHGDGDLYDYDEADVSGFFKFRWQRYETDGFVLGPCPSEEDLCVEITIKRASNIDGISLVSWHAESGQLRELLADGGLVPVGEHVQLCTRCSKSVDCAGTHNGAALKDRCGVCGGDGNSCLVGNDTLAAAVGAVVMLSLFCFVGALIYAVHKSYYYTAVVVHHHHHGGEAPPPPPPLQPKTPYTWQPMTVRTAMNYNQGSVQKNLANTTAVAIGSVPQQTGTLRRHARG
jgi:hypothetical protein